MKRFLATSGAVLAAVVAIGAPATAITDQVSFTIAAASNLSISAGGASSTIDSGGSNPVFDAVSSSSVSGALNAVTVTDARGTLLAPWTVTVSGAAFVNGSDPAQTIAASNAHVYLNATDLTDLTTNVLAGLITGMTVTSAELTAGLNNLSSPYTLIGGTSATGNGSVTFTPTIDVTIPAGTPAGTYSATVTQTVS